MKYVLWIPILENPPEIEISEESYKSYKDARTILVNCLAIEEKYEILISNYLDWEKQILDVALTDMVRMHSHSHYSEFFDFRLALNIRLMNLLTSTKLYIDQLSHHVSECVPLLGDAKKVVKSIFAKEYAENWEYRFMEALRNYVQHRGLPVHSISTGGRWTESGEEGLLEYRVEVAVQKSLLEEDEKFKKGVLNDIPDTVDLKAVTRYYIESLSRGHEAVRELIQESVQNSRLCLEAAHSQYNKIYTGSLVGLSACIIDGDRLVEKIPLFLDRDDIRVKLQNRNQKLVNLKKRYVTSKVRKS